ncbi:MAG: peptidylprolyl isomerase [Acidobacteria bacterium]|jgi:peptidyl-prolyl cis-trans isomerase A (cyclophilin A)|nr:peptidylprolyl isomerase [Acidobacteriota bacterium]
MRLTVLALTLTALLSTLAPGTAAAQARAKTNRGNLGNPALLKETAPEKFQARFTTSKGNFVIEVTRAWAPNGADRFYNLVKNGYYDNCRFFRVVDGFMVQFGINGDPGLNRVWNTATIKDDPVKQSNKEGYVTFATTAAPNSRATQIFINFADNPYLDRQRFAPFGKVVEGMDVVNAINKEYGEKPDQGKIMVVGNSYLQKEFPRLDFIKSATIVAGVK